MTAPRFQPGDESLNIATPDGADLSVVWLAKGGATISIGGDQPMDQPPCSITLGPALLMKLAAHLREGLSHCEDAGDEAYWDDSGRLHITAASYYDDPDRVHGALLLTDTDASRRRMDQ